MKTTASGGRRAASAMALILVFALPAHAQDIGIEVGSMAPAAKVHTLDGKDANLSQYIGKTPILMEFWATWCPNCKELEPALKAMAAKYGKQVTFIGMAVSVNQSPERVKKFVADHQLPGEQFFDTKGDASGAYDAPATSYVVVIDKKGKVVYTGLGGRQNLEAAIKKAL
jgi:thiol-disulfide isomerase/thioredoxin